MSILIKGLKMPTSCCDCPIGGALCCSLMPGVPALWKEYTIAVRTNRRHSDCPLIEVPPHGRLIDRDFNLVKAELIQHLRLSSGADNGAIYWYEGTIPLLWEMIAFVLCIEEVRE